MIPAGLTSATIDIAAIDDNIAEASEDVTLTITSTDNSAITIDSAAGVITIADDDNAVVSIVANVPNAAEGTSPVDGQFTISLSNPSDSLTTVTYTVSGTATSGADFVSLPGSVTLLPGQTTATIDLSVIDDLRLEQDETVTITLDSVNGNAAIGPDSVATVTIDDNEINQPNLVTPDQVNIAEDTPSAVFQIDASVPETDGSESLQVTLSGVPVGVTFTDGVNRFTGSADQDSIDISDWDLTNLTVETPANSDEEFSVNISATSFSSDPSDNTPPITVNDTIDFVVDAVADAPNLGVTSTATGVEDQPIALNIDASLLDTDGSEELLVSIGGVPAGAVLSAGTIQADGTWLLSPEDLADLTITPPSNSDGEIQLTVTAIATEVNPSPTDPTVVGGPATTTETIDLQIDAVADTPTLTVDTSIVADEDDAIALNISGELLDNDGSETLVVQISGLPAGSSLSAGTDLGDGTWTLTQNELAGLTLFTPPNSDTELQLTVTATSSESNPTDGDTTVAVAESSIQETVDIRLDAVADPPIMTVPASITAAEGIESQPIGLSAIVADTDGSETLRVVISDIGPGVTISDGTNSYLSTTPDGTVDVSGWTLENITVTPDDGPPQDFVLTITATATESNPSGSDRTVSVTSTSTTSQVFVAVSPVNDAPIGVSDQFSITPERENLDIAGNVLTNDIDEENDPLSAVVVEDVQNGTLDFAPDGSFTYVPDAGFLGIDSFTYQATDGELNTQLVTVEIGVNIGGGGIGRPSASGPIDGSDPNPAKGISPEVLDSTSSNPVQIEEPESTSPSIEEMDPEADAIEETLGAVQGQTDSDNADAQQNVATNAVTDALNNFDRDTSFDQLFLDYSRDSEQEAKEEEQAEQDESTDESLLWDSLDEMSDREAPESVFGGLFAGVAAFLFAAISYFYVLWTVWSGYLVSSLMSMMPGWKFMDPLPILDEEKDADSAGNESEDESLEDLVRNKTN